MYIVLYMWGRVVTSGRSSELMRRAAFAADRMTLTTPCRGACRRLKTAQRVRGFAGAAAGSGSVYTHHKPSRIARIQESFFEPVPPAHRAPWLARGARKRRPPCAGGPGGGQRAGDDRQPRPGLRLLWLRSRCLEPGDRRASGHVFDDDLGRGCAHARGHPA